MSGRRLLLAALAACAVLVASGAAARALRGSESGSGSQHDEPSPLVGVDDMPTGLHGTLVVGWRTEAGDREHEIELSAYDGSIVASADGRTAMGADKMRWLRVGGGWLTLSASDPRALIPPPVEKYELAVTAGDAVAGRATTVVEATVRGASHPVQRLVLDEELGFVLGRTWLDSDGNAVRWVHFVDLDEVGSSESPPTEAPPSSGRMPEMRERLGDPYTDPAELPSGFVLVGRYAHPDRLVQLHYSDGLASVSVFEQPGRLRKESLPSERGETLVEGHPVYEWVGPAGRMMVWEHSGVVYTLVGDATYDDLLKLSAAVDDGSDSLVDRVTESLLGPFGL